MHYAPRRPCSLGELRVMDLAGILVTFSRSVDYYSHPDSRGRPFPPDLQGALIRSSLIALPQREDLHDWLVAPSPCRDGMRAQL